MVKQKYGDATALLKQLLAADPKDFGAWAELGTTFFLQDKFADAENAYRRALEEKPRVRSGFAQSRPGAHRSKKV
jgi:cytochrome c-type biogenesis protein CcmH/NrfG